MDAEALYARHQQRLTVGCLIGRGGLVAATVLAGALVIVGTFPVFRPDLDPLE